MAESTLPPIVQPLVGVALCAYLSYVILIYPFFFHPLRRIPSAHWSVPIPGIGYLWILHRRYVERNNRTTYAAHLKYGPIVRLGYNELSVNCVENGIRTVYGGGWEKHDWYPRQFRNYGVTNMFSTVHHAPHSQKKRTIANIYSKNNLQVSAQLKANTKHLMTTRFLPLLQSLGETGEATNVHEMNNAFTMDFMSAYLFGIGQSTNFTQDVESRREVLHQYHSRRPYSWHSSEVSPMLKRTIARLRVPFVPTHIDRANEFLENWLAKMVESANEYLSEQRSTDPENLGDEPVVLKHFQTGIAKLREKDPQAGWETLPHFFDLKSIVDTSVDLKALLEEEVKSEMMDHLAAGHETSAIALTYLLWELSRNASLQEILHQELVGLTPQIRWPLPSDEVDIDFTLPEPKVIYGLPQLHAVMMEALRLHAPIPGMEPRVSPNVVGGSTLGSYSGIPGGVRVSSMPYTLHRNPDVFPDPETFNPSRWLIEDEIKLKEMNRWFWAFGSGGRMCIGSHLAVQEIKLIIAAIYSNWTTHIVDDEGIEALDAYTTRPTSDRLMLRFAHR